MQVTRGGPTAVPAAGSIRRPPFPSGAASFAGLLAQNTALPGLAPGANLPGFPYRIPRGGVPIGFDSAALAYEPLIQAAAARHGVPAGLVRAVVRVESGFNPLAVSSAGARGLMQLMPGTAAGLGVTNSFDPVQNVDAGVRYLRRQLDAFGSVPLALAAYHAGPAAVREHGGLPPFPTTQRYVERVLSLYAGGAGDGG